MDPTPSYWPQLTNAPFLWHKREVQRTSAKNIHENSEICVRAAACSGRNDDRVNSVFQVQYPLFRLVGSPFVRLYYKNGAFVGSGLLFP